MTTLETVTKTLSLFLTLEPEKITPETQLSSLGMEDYDVTVFCMDLEDEFNIIFSVSECDAMHTVQDIVDQTDAVIAREKAFDEQEQIDNTAQESENLLPINQNEQI